MQKLSKDQIIEKIQTGQLFECESIDGAFVLKIQEYTPVVCAAVHAGDRLRESLVKFCALSKEERKHEEDPFTDQFIQSMPITLVAKDSRYEYDLNRPISRCIYSRAWGKEVWAKKLSQKERELSIKKHRNFYSVLDALTSKLEAQFGTSLIFDVHSYNAVRISRDTPTFNIGTEQIDLDRWNNVLKYLNSRLEKIVLPNFPVKASFDDVFFGRGYLISHINSRHANTLVIPLEIKKIFMDEATHELFPLLFGELHTQFLHCLTETSAYFMRRFTKKVRVKRTDLLTSKVDTSILKVDKALHSLAKNLETLNYINPTNITQEKKSFFNKKFNYEPEFKYRPLEIDPFLFREQLYRLPVDLIQDPDIQSLYRDVIDGLSTKIDMLVNAGRDNFVYNSLRYYGEPSYDDEKNAEFLLHACDFEVEEEEVISANELVERFKASAKAWGMPCKVELSSKLVAAAMVSNSRKTVLVNRDTKKTETDARALIHHELGVHMATTLNANLQKLKVFSIGLPGNTMTQEGLAILNEYHSGNLPLRRLKRLALRVLAVREMLKVGDFRHTFHFLYEDKKMPANEAFSLAVRVHRGNGFTKDYLYLRGVSEALSLSELADITGLYVGKTGFQYLGVINDLIAREIVSSPKYIPEYLYHSKQSSEILNYLIRSIRTKQGVRKNVLLEKQAA